MVKCVQHKHSQNYNHVAISGSTDCHVTGLPYSLKSSNDGWSESGNVTWNKDGYKVRLGYNLSNWGASGTANITKSFYIPADIDISLSVTGNLRGSGGSNSRYQTTFTTAVSGKDVYSTKSTSGSYLDFSSGHVSTVMTSLNTSVKLNNSYSTSEACTRISTLTLEYRD